MAAVAKSGSPTPCTMDWPNTAQVGSGLIVGEDIDAADACYIKSDGLVWKSTGAAANAAAKVRGFATTTAKVASNDSVTLLDGVDWRYGAGLTPGADLFLSAATPGALSDVATTGGTAPIGFVIDATRVRLFASRY